MLDGFRVYQPIIGSPTMAVTRFGIGINKAGVVRLQHAPYVQILFNGADRIMAIKTCQENDEGAMPLMRGAKRDGARWNNKELTKKVASMAGMPSDDGFKVEGTVFEEDGYILFDLKQAEPLDDVKRDTALHIAMNKK